MKKKYDRRRLWSDKDNPGQPFTAMVVEFTRPLTSEERNDAILHFVNGLREHEVEDKYMIHSITFLDANFLELTVQSIALDQDSMLLWLLVKFREKFPVVMPSDSDNEDRPDAKASG